MDTVEVTVWVLVNEIGDYVASEDRDHLGDRWDESIGDELPAGEARRVVKVTLKVPKPKPFELAGTVAAEPAAGELQAV